MISSGRGKRAREERRVKERRVCHSMVHVFAWVVGCGSRVVVVYDGESDSDLIDEGMNEGEIFDRWYVRCEVGK